MDNEWQDIVDDNDVVVGKDTRNNIWDKGMESRVRVVNLFVVDGDKSILMPVRSKTKKKWPLCYDFACGENVQSGETYEQAIVRGIKEELGLNNLVPVEISYLKPKDGAPCFTKNYKIEVDRENFNPVLNSDEVDHFEWKTIDEVRTMLQETDANFKRGYKDVFISSFN